MSRAGGPEGMCQPPRANVIRGDFGNDKGTPGHGGVGQHNVHTCWTSREVCCWIIPGNLRDPDCGVELIVFYLGNRLFFCRRFLIRGTSLW